MDFETQKNKTLSKADYSKKGSIDKEIEPFLNKVNSLPNYYTTSSCAGRIDVISLSESKRKDESEWLFVSHQPVMIEEILNSLKSLPNNEVWFRMESAIVHICCKTLDDATSLLIKAKEAGLKHSGILSITEKRIIVEIFGSEKIDTIIAKNSKLIVDNNYLGILVEIANSKLKETRKKIDKLKNQIS
jgi:tRNA wybutosine-synthesizing protein 3